MASAEVDLFNEYTMPLKPGETKTETYYCYTTAQLRSYYGALVAGSTADQE